MNESQTPDVFSSMLEETPTDLPMGGEGMGEGGGALPPLSPTALEVDEWAMRQGLSAYARSRKMQENLQTSEHPEDDAADCFAIAFEPTPRLAPNPRDKIKAEYIEALMGTSNYRTLHHDTRLDYVASGLAAIHFADGLAGAYEDQKNREEGEDGNMPGPGGMPGPPGAEGMQRAMAAASAAGKDVNQLQDARDAFGCGSGAGTGQTFDLDQAKDLFKRLRDDPRLRRLMELAGKYQAVAQSKQRERTTHGQDDMVGVALGGDIAQLIPSELASLASPETEWDAMRRIVERQAMVREWSGLETKGRGPIVCVIDESGSMGREQSSHSKALALALYWIARHQRRGMVFRAFSGESGLDASNNPLDLNKLTFQDLGMFGRRLVVTDDIGPQQVLEWVSSNLGGGTSDTVPFHIVPAEWEGYGLAKGKADIVLLTDACFSVGAAGFEAWKEANEVRLQTILIGATIDDDSRLAHLSDRIAAVRHLSHDGEEIGELLSID